MLRKFWERDYPIKPIMSLNHESEGRCNIISIIKVKRSFLDSWYQSSISFTLLSYVVLLHTSYPRYLTWGFMPDLIWRLFEIFFYPVWHFSSDVIIIESKAIFREKNVFKFNPTIKFHAAIKTGIKIPGKVNKPLKFQVR